MQQHLQVARRHRSRIPRRRSPRPSLRSPCLSSAQSPSCGGLTACWGRRRRSSLIASLMPGEGQPVHFAPALRVALPLHFERRQSLKRVLLGALGSQWNSPRQPKIGETRALTCRLLQATWMPCGQQLETPCRRRTMHEQGSRLYVFSVRASLPPVTSRKLFVCRASEGLSRVGSPISIANISRRKPPSKCQSSSSYSPDMERDIARRWADNSCMRPRRARAVLV
mmetsp:Transcript_32049/g.70063  ORF Transcript_32049/g.70063 Transcript_32049/m.70063 type:complete len:225 (-) Transcript_32049:1932-2606(-)